MKGARSAIVGFRALFTLHARILSFYLPFVRRPCTTMTGSRHSIHFRDNKQSVLIMEMTSIMFKTKRKDVKNFQNHEAQPSGFTAKFSTFLTSVSTINKVIDNGRLWSICLLSTQSNITFLFFFFTLNTVK